MFILLKKLQNKADLKDAPTIVSVLTICLRKSSRAESKSAESLLKLEISLLSSENTSLLCFFKALKEKKGRYDVK